jgi:hypothetical protein
MLKTVNNNTIEMMKLLQCQMDCMDSIKEKLDILELHHIKNQHKKLQTA